MLQDALLKMPQIQRIQQDIHRFIPFIPGALLGSETEAMLAGIEREKKRSEWIRYDGKARLRSQVDSGKWKTPLAKKAGKQDCTHCTNLVTLTSASSPKDPLKLPTKYWHCVIGHSSSNDRNVLINFKNVDKILFVTLSLSLSLSISLLFLLSVYALPLGAQG